ncbi:MAG: TRAP transporter substrate-binding protein DctP [Rhodobiaceae bacterium]|nr:TRAP transporter substrate-binding protein DctP [Rhodobiaceae bacterium]MCC0056227.1 TRAP transporter substrate-binding protein DctP [Rhodobiaceae bacterium]
MKLRSYRFQTILAVALFGLVTTTSAGLARDLKMSLFVKDSHFLATKVFVPMAKNIEAFSNGELKVEVFASGVLGKTADQLQIVENGIADMALIVPNYTRGRFPFFEAASLPFAFTSAVHGCKVFDQLREKYLNESFDTVKPLVVCVSALSGLLTKTKQISSLDQLNGMTLRGSGNDQTKIMAEFGANTVNMPITDVYVAMERGTIDGVIMPIGSASGYKLEEIAKYYTLINFASTPLSFIMSETVWASLTPAQQEAVSKAARIAQEAMGVAYDESEEDGLKVFAAAGGKTNDLPEAEVAKLKSSAAPFWDEFEANLAKQKDADTAKAFMADFRKLIEESAAK